MDAFIYEPASWVAAAFILFMVGFVKYALPHVTRGLDSHSAKVSEELKQAVALREEAQAVLAEYQHKQQEVLAEAEKILKHAQAEAEAMKVDAEKEIQEAIDRRTKLANEKISRAENDAVRQVQENMVEIATTAARTIIVEHLESASDEELIEFALENVDRIVH